jgi:hypothetical protein
MQRERAKRCVLTKRVCDQPFVALGSGFRDDALDEGARDAAPASLAGNDDRELGALPVDRDRVRASEEAIATNILASRLAKLRKAGLISKSVDEKRQTIYLPTQKALDLKPVLTELARWGLKYDRHARVPKARLG